MFAVVPDGKGVGEALQHGVGEAGVGQILKARPHALYISEQQRKWAKTGMRQAEMTEPNKQRESCVTSMGAALALYRGVREVGSVR